MRVKFEIKTKEDIKMVLDNLKPYEQNYINKLRENSIEYELACEKVMEYLIEIEEALIGKEPYNSENIANADIRIWAYWDYLKGKTTIGKLFKSLKQYSTKLLIDLE
jgi:glutathionyl-hydroquinone reductase